MSQTVQVFAEETQLLVMEQELRADRELRGVRMERRQLAPATDELGPSTEALQWVSDNNELLAAVVSAVAAWVAQRRSRVRVRIGRREVEIDSAKMGNPEATAERLRELLRDEQA
jgi:hypothetical protein